MAEKLCRAALLTGLGDYVEELGFSFPRILESAGLDEEAISNPNFFIPLVKECAVLDIAADTCENPALMIEVANRQTLNVFGAIGALAMGSGDVRGGITTFERYLTYSLDAVNVRLEEEDDVAFFTLHSDYGPIQTSPQFWTHGVALMCQVIRILCGRRWSPRSVFLDLPAPAELSAYSDFFRAPLAFGQGRNGIAFPSEVLSWPVDEHLSSMSAELRHHLSNNVGGGFESQVRAILSATLAAGKCSAASVALSLGVSERTLQRRLHEEGTSFRKVQEEERSLLAVNYMREPQLRLTDIASMLGYADLAVFSRSFKRWYGLSPRQWRTQSRLSQVGSVHQ